jgi:hypothetical protein
VLVLAHSVIVTLVDPYDGANVIVTWAGRDPSP